MSAPPTEQTIVRYVSPSGRQLTLSGGPDAGRYGVWAGQGPNGLGHVETKALFDAAARQVGEEYVGTTVDHQELELPLFVLRNNRTGINGLRQTREWLKTLFERERVGWLLVYTPVTGWRWLAVRRGYLKPALGADPNRQGGLHLELLLLVEKPYARQPDSTDEWTNEHLTGRGSLLLRAGPEVHSWPRFTFFGPGTATLRYGNNELTLPFASAGQQVLVNTDEARPTVRYKNADGTTANALPLLKGRKFREPVYANPDPRATTRVDVEVTGGDVNTGLFGVCELQYEGLL